MAGECQTLHLSSILFFHLVVTDTERSLSWGSVMLSFLLLFFISGDSHTKLPYVLCVFFTYLHIMIYSDWHLKSQACSKSYFFSPHTLKASLSNVNDCNMCVCGRECKNQPEWLLLKSAGVLLFSLCEGFLWITGTYWGFGYMKCEQTILFKALKLWRRGKRMQQGVQSLFSSFLHSLSHRSWVKKVSFLWTQFSSPCNTFQKWGKMVNLMSVSPSVSVLS